MLHIALSRVPAVSCAATRTFFEKQMEHLTCFVAGNLALGVSSGAVTGGNATKYLDLAKNLTATCYQMYRHTPTGGVVAPGMQRSGLRMAPVCMPHETLTASSKHGVPALRPLTLVRDCPL